MSFRLDINGVEIRCDTVTEAMALAKHAASASKFHGGTDEKRGRANHAETTSQKRRIQQAQLSLRFLVAVCDAGEKGISGRQLVKMVKCNGPPGLGNVKQVTERLLREAGISLEDVAERRRNGNDKLWFAGPQIQQGIRALQEAAKKE